MRQMPKTGDEKMENERRNICGCRLQLTDNGWIQNTESCKLVDAYGKKNCKED
tara:strand:+ start:747 stop:905 length:159 start_codon:yes stop_codon:yes gene_type:complete